MRRAAAGLPENATSIDGRVDDPGAGLRSSWVPCRRVSCRSRSGRRSFLPEACFRVRLWSESTCASTIVFAIHSIARNCRPRRGAASLFGSDVAYSSKPRLKFSGNCTLLARARSISVGHGLPQLRLEFVRLERRLRKHPRLQLVLQRKQRIAIAIGLRLRPAEIFFVRETALLRRSRVSSLIVVSSRACSLVGGALFVKTRN